jgi:hypothetical protein
MPASEISQRFLSAFDAWEAPAELPRPRLFLSAGALAELRRLPDSGAPEWERLKEAAAAAVGHDLRHALPGCGLAYLASREERYAAALVAAAERMLAIPDWVPPAHRRAGHVVDLHVAHNVRELAWAYDWLYDYLTPEQRKRFAEAILHRGLELFLPAHRDGTESWARATDNWRAVICGEMGLAAIVVASEWPQAKESLRESLEGVLATLEANPADGGYTEGPDYWTYGMGFTTWFVEGLRTFTGGAVDLYQHPYMQRTADFALHMTAPDLGSFNFGDARGRAPSAEVLGLLAARTGNPHAQWLADRIGGFSPLSLLWRREAPAPCPPDDLPRLVSFPAAGATVLRSDWSEQALYLGLKTGETTADHSHLDINSLILVAFGERLLDDTGLWHYDHGGGFFECEDRRWDYAANATGGHSTLLVDGQGQRWGRDHKGEIVHVQAGPDFSYAVAAGAAAYGPEVLRFDRHVLLAAEGYVLVIDDVETDGPRRLEWRWQTRGKVDLALLAQNRWQIVRRNAALDSDLLWPDGGEGRMVTQSQVVAHYFPTLDRRPELVEETLSYVAVAPLHRQQRAVMVAVLHPRPLTATPAPMAHLVSRDEAGMEIAVPHATGETRWVIRPRERSATRL